MAIFHCIALKAWWFNARCRLKRSSESLLSTLRLYGTKQPPRRLGRWTFPCARTNMLGRSTTWPCAPPLSLGHRSPVKILLYGHNSSYYFFTNNIFFSYIFWKKKKKHRVHSCHTLCCSVLIDWAVLFHYIPPSQCPESRPQGCALLYPIYKCWSCLIMTQLQLHAIRWRHAFFFFVLVTRIGTDCLIVWMGIMGFEGMAGVPPASWSRPHLLAWQGESREATKEWKRNERRNHSAVCRGRVCHLHSRASNN